ncbi:leukocyte immunoglobulin-like receptor subfamily A member 6 [Capricornis sumatraensis]|uniref:leukocyte immunoglobulin-like receptor subfamily A member 6 n=1 Tax=Capricornis sumatraensis TaxID=34865 RepID=UPI003604F0EF
MPNVITLRGPVFSPHTLYGTCRPTHRCEPTAKPSASNSPSSFNEASTCTAFLKTSGPQPHFLEGLSLTTSPFSISEATAQPERGIMSMVFPSLLCLGLCLSQSTWAQKGNLRPPRITALPGFTVPPKSPVTLLCQGPGQAEGYKISKVGSPEPMDKEEQITPRKTNTLRITDMTTDKTGLYHCSYQRGGRWSQFSDPLQLVMTGAYPKPSLSSLAGTVAAPGQNVKLQCFSKITHDVFILTKDGDHITQNQSSAPQDRGRQTIFLLSPVSSTQAGTYRCYGAFLKDPYVWSQPSDPLQLQVEGTTESPSSTQPRRSTAPAAWHPSLETQVRLSLAALLLLAMVVLLAEAWCSRGGGPSRSGAEAGGQPERRVMSVVPTSLLCLGLCLSQSTWAQKGNLRPPRITALPGSTVSPKSHVTLLCQGPKQAEGYKISKVGSPELMDKEEQITPRKTNSLSIAEITTDKTGLYHCSYQRGGRWSQFSDPLQLVMTGAYPKPSLSSLAGTVAAPGQNVKLQCFSKITHDVFILTKDGDHITQTQSSTPQDRGRQTIFLLNPVSSTQAGTYRCYGAFLKDPYVWSQPSDPLQLQVEGTTDSPSSTQHTHSTGAAAPTSPLFSGTTDSPSSTQPRRSTAPSSDLASRGRLLGIWIGVPVAVGLLLLVFLIFLILYCLRKAKSDAARKERQPEAAGRANGQASEAADPQEVTYSQVTCHVPHQGTAGAPSWVPRQTQSSEYVTLAFR